MQSFLLLVGFDSPKPFLGVVLNRTLRLLSLSPQDAYFPSFRSLFAEQEDVCEARAAHLACGTINDAIAIAVGGFGARHAFSELGASPGYSVRVGSWGLIPVQLLFR